MRRLLAVACLLIGLVGCSSSSSDGLRIQDITLPNGKVIHAELALTPVDITRGLMFRESLAPDHGMLFVFSQPVQMQFFMYHTLIPLDMIWLDADHNIVEMAENVQPCKVAANDCPKYGGTVPAQYVLEIGGGMAAKYGLHKGVRLSF